MSQGLSGCCVGPRSNAGDQEVHKGQGLRQEGRKKWGSACEALSRTGTRWNMYTFPSCTQVMRRPLLTVRCDSVSVVVLSKPCSIDVDIQSLKGNEVSGAESEWRTQRNHFTG